MATNTNQTDTGGRSRDISPASTAPGKNRSGDGMDNKEAEVMQEARATTTDASETLENMKDTARSFYEQAKSSAGDAYDTVAEKATSSLEERKAGLAEGLTGVADTVRRVSGTLNEDSGNTPVAEYAARYTDTAAKAIDDIAGYFDRTDLRGMARDLESFARRNPAVFLGSAFALGIMAARLLKSSPRPTVNQFPTDVDHQLTSGETGTRGESRSSTSA